MSLNQAQADAVAIGQGPALVVAGAGTGKTRVIIERLHRLLETGTPPERLLALTFTEKAAAEMVDRLNERRQTYELELPIMTFNAYGETLLRQYAADLGRGRNFTLMSDQAVIVFLRERLDDLGLDYFAPVGRPDSLLGDIADYFSTLKQHVITPDDYLAHAAALPYPDAATKLNKAKHTELAHAYVRYTELCREANVIDYDDQIYLVLELFRRRPNVLKEVQAKYDYVMVDEFQDTNTMQAQLTDLVAGRGNNLFVVGDDDQSIYGWRGATLANILNFKERYPKAQEVTLLHNYRSTTQILDAAYRLIQANNPHRLEERLKINKRLVAERSGPEPAVHCFKLREEELAWVAQDIQQRLQSGTPGGAIAVLARRNASIMAFHEYLEGEGIEHTLAGQRYELYREPVVRMLLEALKAVVDPTDSSSLYHCLSGPLFDISPHYLSSLAAQAKSRHQPLLEAIEADQSAPAEPAKAAVAAIHQWREKIALLSVGQLAYDMLESSGYKDKLYGLVQTDPETALAVSRLSELFQNMKEFEKVALQPSARQYVEALPALQAAGEGGEDPSLDLSGNMVNLLTIHRAKGLEWPVVYIVDAAEGSFPLPRSANSFQLPEGLLAEQQVAADEHILEERRLMYVAMTRAKDELLLTYAERLSPQGRSRKASRFLEEAFGKAEPQHHAAAPHTALPSLQQRAVPNDVPLPAKMVDGTLLTLTVSQAQKYLDCPLDFYYCHILNVPRPGSPMTEYGNLLHHLMEDINHGLVAGTVPPLKDLLRRLEAEFPHAGYLTPGQRDRLQQQGHNTITRLHQLALQEGRVPQAIEEPFAFTLPDGNLRVHGRFDAVFTTDKGVEIVDYKTSATIDTPEKAKRRATASQQLTLYALAWQLLHDEIPAQVSLNFIDTGMIGSLKKTQASLDTMRQKLMAAAEGIRGGEFPPGKDHLFCIHPPL